MIWICDVPSVPQSLTPSYNGNCEPADTHTVSGHSACPANRHNYRTDVLFCDGHVESPKRNDLRSPSSDLWRARWNNDNNPHNEAGSLARKPSMGQLAGPIIRISVSRIFPFPPVRRTKPFK